MTTGAAAWWRARRADLCAWLVMLGAVLAVYCPWSVLSGRATLLGVDYLMLHARRMAFARAALFGPLSELPAWYPRELLGTPFRANLQNFPLIPTRLLVFALFDPAVAFAPGVVLSACLAAAFTYLLCRRLGRSRVASAVAGWTVACCGFFASHVLAGHLPLLEAYPALPVLLYAVERVVRRPEATSRGAWNGPLITLGVASVCFALVGHPQLTLYSLVVAVVFAFVRAPRVARAWSTLAVLALGAGLAGFALAPMAALTGRSTRVLELDAAANDLALPYGRLGAMFSPWKDGWPDAVQRAPAVVFHGYTSDAYFWDTVSYVGLAPWLAVAALLVALAARREHVTRVGWFFAASSVLALALALPWLRALMSQLPGTFLRSPARLLFVTSFGLALALAVGLDRLTTVLGAARVPRWVTPLAVAAVLALHGFDLASHALAFVVTRPPDMAPDVERIAEMRERVGEGRIGIDYGPLKPFNRDIDDVGCFDSLLLARPYRFVLETSGFAPRFNEQALNGSQLRPRTLRACSVRYVWTQERLRDLREIVNLGDARIYEVDGAQPRADFVPWARVRLVAGDELHRLLRDPSFALDQSVLVDASWSGAMSLAASSGAGASLPSVRYERPRFDEIAVAVVCGESGLVRVLEAWDPGWSASLDGEAAAVIPAHDTFLSACVGPGTHALRFRYRTPGAEVGLVLSLASAVMLAWLAHRLR